MSRARILHNRMSRSRSALNRPWLRSDEQPRDVIAIPEPIDPWMRRTATRVRVIHTFVCYPPGPVPEIVDYYGVMLSPDDEPALGVVTRDETLYQLALALEGEPRTCDVVWHPTKRPDGQWVRSLDALRVTS